MSKHTLPILAVFVITSCMSPAERECTRTSDCEADEFCRMGFCVLAVAHDDVDLRDTAGSRRTASRRRTDGRTAPTRPGGADSSAVDASDAKKCDGRAPGPDDLAVNEILVDVPSGSAGDANGDGRRDASDDEFVELVNRADERLDLSDVQLLEDGEVNTTLGPTCLAPNDALVLFGGGDREAFSAPPPDATYRTADSSFGFSNSGGTFALHGPDGTAFAQVTWDDPPAESLTLQPQITGTARRPHTELAPDRKMSPGRCADGTELEGGCPASKTRDAGDTGNALDAGDAND